MKLWRVGNSIHFYVPNFLNLSAILFFLLLSQDRVIKMQESNLAHSLQLLNIRTMLRYVSDACTDLFTL